MPSITIRGIPEDLYDRVRAMAEANRRSINSQILVCLQRAVGSRRGRVEDEIAEARAIRERTAQYMTDDEAFNEAKRRGRP